MRCGRPSRKNASAPRQGWSNEQIVLDESTA
jgi:hypothetical protein